MYGKALARRMPLLRGSGMVWFYDPRELPFNQEMAIEWHYRSLHECVDEVLWC